MHITNEHRKRRLIKRTVDGKRNRVLRMINDQGYFDVDPRDRGTHTAVAAANCERNISITFNSGDSTLSSTEGGAPIVVDFDLNYPTRIMDDIAGYQVDTEVLFDTELPSGVTITVTYNGSEEATDVELTEGTTSFYLSDILGDSPTNLIDYENSTDSWVFSISGLTESTYEMTYRVLLNTENNWSDQDISVGELDETLTITS